MTPTFKMHGSKARTAPWLVNFFPQKFERWIEPFAGRGNVFFRAATSGLTFESACLNDTGTHRFLTALRDHAGGFEFVDAAPIDKKLWQTWVEAPESPEKHLAESYVARFGDTFKMGPNTTCHRNGHSRENTIKRMKAARELLREKHTAVASSDWESFLKDVSPGAHDVVYLDPPYDVKQNVHYAGIDQDKFLSLVKGLPSWVFISGYTSERYESALQGWNRETRVRASTGKSQTGGKKPRVEEILWWRGPLSK